MNIYKLELTDEGKRLVADDDKRIQPPTWVIVRAASEQAARQLVDSKRLSDGDENEFKNFWVVVASGNEETDLEGIWAKNKYVLATDLGPETDGSIVAQILDYEGKKG